MANAITYNSTSINDNSNLITRTIIHDQSPDRVLNTIKLTRQDGEIIVNDSYNPKEITVEGVIVGSSQSDMESRLDTLKALVAQKDKNLDIDYAGGTRRYVCRNTKFTCTRDSFNIFHAPYTIVFYVAKGIGTNTSETNALTATGITAATDARSVVFAGSYQPRPRHKVTITTRGNADTVRVINYDTGDYMDVDLDGFSDTDYFEIDEENQTVKKNGSTNINWSGKFPSVNPGTINMRLITKYGGYTLDQNQTASDTNAAFYENTTPTRNPMQGQSFVPSESGRVGKVSVILFKDGAPGGTVQFVIYADDNGKPGSPVGSAIFNIAAASVSSSNIGFVDIVKTSGETFLVAGTRYWLVFNSGTISGTDSLNYYMWAYSTDPTDYVDGKAMARQTNTLGFWQDGNANAQLNSGGQGGVNVGEVDMSFKIYFGDGAAASWTLAWKIDYTKKYL